MSVLHVKQGTPHCLYKIPLFCYRLRWTVRGVPRVPWEAEGIFDGISEYKLDRTGKIYEHKLTNVQMRDPPLARSPLSIGLNLIPIPRLQGAPQVLPTRCLVCYLDGVSGRRTQAARWSRQQLSLPLL